MTIDYIILLAVGGTNDISHLQLIQGKTALQLIAGLLSEIQVIVGA
ncbi:hypothetical protein [Scytonema sp. HK-05]|nr:hypothetical protein [Scytonema sp. HK-05]